MFWCCQDGRRFQKEFNYCSLITHGDMYTAQSFNHQILLEQNYCLVIVSTFLRSFMGKLWILIMNIVPRCKRIFTARYIQCCKSF